MANQSEPGGDRSGIFVSLFRDVAAMPRINIEQLSLPMHQHDRYELSLLVRGGCEFYYHRSHVPLVPGDLILLPPGQPHACRFQADASVFRCQFSSDAVSMSSPEELLRDMTPTATPQESVSQRQLRSLGALEWSRLDGDTILPHKPTPEAQQAVYHLKHTENVRVSEMFQDILREQNKQSFGFERMKRLLLEQLLILVKRTQINQFDSIRKEASWKQEMVDAVLTQIDQDFSREVNFAVLARQRGITLTYFRSVFKEITGLPPTDYLNRIRILRALELLQASEMPISEIAARVGILDANYFTRLFKKIIGHPPSYYKAIHTAGTST